LETIKTMGDIPLMPGSHFKVIDNFLNKKDFKKIQERLLAKDFPWYYTPNITFVDESKTDKYYFTHLFYYHDRPLSPSIDILQPLFKKMDITSLYRVKGNFYPNIGKQSYNKPHKDFSFKHKSAIFYINNNDGYTILNNGKTKIESIANRILFFDSTKNHSSTHCTNDHARVNININYF